MTQYSYRAVDASGQEVSGTIEAMSLQAAREDLLMQKLEPIEITEAPMHNSTSYETSSTPEEVKGPIAAEADAQYVVSEKAYFPLYITLRLYAGWLLAWYCLVYAVGSYQFMKDVPVHIPYAESLFLSPLVLSFTFGAYLFLLLSDLYKYLGSKKPVAVVLTLVGIAAFLLYRMNVS